MEFEPGAVANGIFGVLVGSGMVAIWLRASASKIRDLELNVTSLRETQIKNLQCSLDEHLKGDQSQRFETKLDTVLRQNTELLQKVSKLDRETGEQDATMKEISSSQKELWRQFNACKDTHRGNQ